MTTPSTPIPVGLVGAGGWARTMHAPLHTAGRETRLVGVWAEDGESAARLAADFAVPVFAHYADLLDACDAVDLAVPPHAQPALALTAAAAGRALMMEKPLGVDLAAARDVVDAIDDAGVANVVVFTKRFHPRTVDFLAEAARLRDKGPVTGASGCYLHGGFLGGTFLGGTAATRWRDEFGVLYDLGPHLLDLADAAAGPIVAVRADGELGGYLTVTTRHADGGTGQWALSGRVGSDSVHTRVEVYSEHGDARYTTAGMDHDECWPVLRAQFAAAVRDGVPPVTDARRALEIQIVLDAITTSAHTGAWVDV